MDNDDPEYLMHEATRWMLDYCGGDQSVDDMDDGRSVDWADLRSERERKIFNKSFWRGVEFGTDEVPLIRCRSMDLMAQDLQGVST